MPRDAIVEVEDDAVRDPEPWFQRQPGFGSGRPERCLHHHAGQAGAAPPDVCSRNGPAVVPTFSPASLEFQISTAAVVFVNQVEIGGTDHSVTSCDQIGVKGDTDRFCRRIFVRARAMRKLALLHVRCWCGSLVAQGLDLELNLIDLECRILPQGTLPQWPILRRLP